MSAPPPAAPPTDAALAEWFLRSLWGGTAGQVALNYALPTRPGAAKRPKLRTEWFPTGEPAAAAARAAALCRDHHVWVGAGRHARPLPAGRRDGSADIVAIPGLWADVDYRHTVHKKAEHLPPDLVAALGLVRTVPPKPTFLVHTGHGLQPWWLFDRPLLLDDPTSRGLAVALLDRLKQHLSGAAADHGWVMDAVADLARVMRLPGLLNIKAEPVPVTLLEGDGRLRYTPADLGTALPQPLPLAAGKPPASARSMPPRPANASDELLLDRAMNARNGTGFARL